MKEEKIGEELKKLKKEIQEKGEEIDELKKRIEELKNNLNQKEEPEKSSEINKMIGEISKLLESSINVFGISGDTPNKTSISGGLAGLINNLASLAEKSESFRKEFDVNGKKAVIDYQIRSGPLRSSNIGRRSLYRRSKQSSVVKSIQEPVSPVVDPIEEKEPIVDIFEEESKVFVMAELPGVSEEEIEWDVKGKTLTIKAGTTGRKYYKEIILPKLVDSKGAESSYRNGVIEISLDTLEENNI
jgi:HSP20 family molecular chaperone IbpA